MNVLIVRGGPAFFGVLFLIAAGMKIWSPAQAIISLEAIEINPRMAELIVASVTVLELYLGLNLLFNKRKILFLKGAVVLMLFFTFYLWYLTTLAEPPSCGCLGLTGVFESSKHEALFSFIRNVILLIYLRYLCRNYNNYTISDTVNALV